MGWHVLCARPHHRTVGPMIGLMVLRGIAGLFSVPLRIAGRFGLKGKVAMVALVASLAIVGMISAHSTAGKSAQVEQQRWAQDAKVANHYATMSPKVPANCQTTTTTSTTNGKVTHTVKKVCK